MKGLTHFIVGLSIATCFPMAVVWTVREGMLILLLGGIFGIMADTLDFRIARFLEKHDYEVDPDPDSIDPQYIAEAMANAIDEAWDNQRPVGIQFHTIKMGPDLWRRYSLRVNSEEKNITCIIGPLIGFSKNALPDSAPTENHIGVAPFRANVLHTYEQDNHVDILSGPDFSFVPDGDHIRIDFIPFHRRWSHSLTFPFLLFPIGFLLYGINEYGFIASFIILFAYWGHVLVDQTGVLGSNLFWPITRKRTSGLAWFHSASSVGNFYTNYIALGIAIWNVNVFTPGPPVIGSHWCSLLNIPVESAAFYWVGLLNMMTYYVFLPLFILSVIVMLHARKEKKVEHDLEAEAALEALQSLESIANA